MVLRGIDREVLPALLNGIEESGHDVWMCTEELIELYEGSEYVAEKCRERKRERL